MKTLSNQAVRDLAWACFAPPLINVAKLPQGTGVSDAQLTLDTERLAWLEALDREPKPLLAHLQNRRSHRLGLYFEALWHFFLEQDARCELLAHNLPVHSEGRTLGEFDCLYRCQETGDTVHLELAVKFFLSEPVDQQKTDAPSRWLGPDAKDRLDLKIDHLLQRQIRLSEQDAANAQLEASDIHITRRDIALRGYLFAQSSDLAKPEGFNDAQPLHRWCRRGQWAPKSDSERKTRYLILQKMRWLSPAMLSRQDTALDSDELSHALDRHFDTDSYPLMITALDQQDHETKRFFVTGDAWPAIRPTP